MMKLFDYQEKAVEDFFQRDGKMILNGGVGCGKTAIALTCANRLRKTTVFFCPSILKRQVFGEALTWCPDMVPVVVEGPTAKTRRASWNVHGAKVDGKDAPVIFICNKELMLHDFDEIAALDPQFVILDEAHGFNNPTAKRVKMLRKLKPKHRLAMSGTPLPNGIHEMYSMTSWVLEPRVVWRNWYQFKSMECRLNPWHGIAGVYDERKLLKILAAVSHVVPRDAVKLPELVEKEAVVDMEDDQKKAYVTMRDELRVKVKNGEVNAINALAMLLRLRQIASHPPILGIEASSAKAEALAEILDMTTEKKVIVFTQFVAAARMLAERFGGRVIVGETPQAERQAVIEAFKNDKGRLLFMSQAGAEGLNLQEVGCVVHYDSTWTYAGHEQRVGRARRKGREEPVVSWKIIVGGTVDEYMDRLVARKQKLGEKLTGLDYMEAIEQGGPLW